MQLRLSNGHVAGPFNSAVPQAIRRHKPQPLFVHQGRELPPQNLYYDKNPYLLRISPSEPRLRPLLTKSRNQSQSRDSSDHGSHRSHKMIRLNGLKEADKPKVARPQGSHSRRHVQRELQLQGENRTLRAENEALKQRLRHGEEQRRREVAKLQEKIGLLLQSTKELENRLEQSQREWKAQMKKLQQNNIDI